MPRAERRAPQLLTVTAVGQRLGISRAGVYRLIAAGHLPSVHLDVSGARVREDDLTAYIEACTDRSRSERRQAGR